MGLIPSMWHFPGPAPMPPAQPAFAHSLAAPGVPPPHYSDASPVMFGCPPHVEPAWRRAPTNLADAFYSSHRDETEAQLAIEAARPKPKQSMLEIVETKASEADTTIRRQMPCVVDVPTPMLEEHFLKLFTVGDLRGQGLLQPDEMAHLLTLSTFSLTDAQIFAIVSAAEVNKDGMISFKEHVPTAARLMALSR